MSFGVGLDEFEDTVGIGQLKNIFWVYFQFERRFIKVFEYLLHTDPDIGGLFLFCDGNFRIEGVDRFFSYNSLLLFGILLVFFLNHFGYSDILDSSLPVVVPVEHLGVREHEYSWDFLVELVIFREHFELLPH